MKKYVDNNESTRAAMERAMGFILPEDVGVVFANVENFKDVREDLEAGVPVIFYGFDSEVSLRLHGHDVAPWFYSKNAAYFQAPFEIVDMIDMYDKIKKGKKIENKAVIFAAKSKYKHTLVGRLLHDIYPGKYGCEEGLKLAEKEFGIKGTIEEVRTLLEKLQSVEATGDISKEIGNEILPGVFCDIEDTLLSSDRSAVKSVVLTALEIAEKEHKKPITLWTGGDVEEMTRLLFQFGIKQYPVVSKGVFRGCQVEIAFDDMPYNEFKMQYGIEVKDFHNIV